jgi:uncharacterized membrane protein
LIPSIFSVPRGTAVFGINNRGEIVGSYCTAVPCGPPLVNNHGFILSQGEFTSFDFPGAEWTRAFAVNDRGDVAGVFTRKNHAFLISKRDENDRVIEPIKLTGDSAEGQSWSAVVA